MFGKTERKTVLKILLLLLLTATIEYYYFGFHNWNFAVPISYDGDGLTGIWGIHNLLTNAEQRTGWPYHNSSTSVFAPHYRMLYVVFVRICSLFVSKPEIVFNSYLFAIPFFNVIVCYLVLCNLKVREWLAYLSALAFGFCPYVQARYKGHMALASIECIPLVLLLCIWCIEDTRFSVWGKEWIKYKRNWISLLFCWMIANNGMIYYPYFSCFLLLVLAICLALFKQSWICVMRPVMMICQIVFCLALGFLPTVLGMLCGYGNAATNGAVRDELHAAIYGLRINALLMSPNGYGIAGIKNHFFNYGVRLQDVEPQTYNENAYAYMGIVAILGFAFLLVLLFSNIRPFKGNMNATRLWMFSRFTIAILFLAVSTGLGTLIAFYIPTMRCYNRISPFLVCISIFAMALCAEEVLSKRYAGQHKRWCLITVTVLVYVFAICEQRACYNYLESSDAVKQGQACEDDRVFINQIENSAGENAMIFQLPYMSSFENGPAWNIPDYDHLKGALYSDTLRWSYGAAKGSDNDIWYQQTSQMEPGDMVSELKSKGFAGIYLNLDGYEEDVGSALQAELCLAALCEQPIMNANGHVVYISF